MLVLLTVRAVLLTGLVLIAAGAILMAVLLALMTAITVLPAALLVLIAACAVLLAMRLALMSARMILIAALAVVLSVPAVVMRLPALRPRGRMRVVLLSGRLNLILNRSLNAILGGRLRRVLCRYMLRHRNRDADELLDVAQESFLLTIAERDGNAIGSRACGAADAMHIGFRDVRHIEIHDMADAVDIDAARSNIRRDERAHAAFAKCSKHAVALVL